MPLPHTFGTKTSPVNMSDLDDNFNSVLPLAGGTVTGTIVLPNTGLHLRDTDASHQLVFVPAANLTADRTLSIDTGDADRTLPAVPATQAEMEAGTEAALRTMSPLRVAQAIAALATAANAIAGLYWNSTAGAFTATRPTGAKSALVEIWGGGAGGQDGNHAGGSGAYCAKVLTNLTGDIAGTVGAGGAAGGNGSATSISSPVSMTAGGGTGLNGGTATGGDVNITGENGIYSSVTKYMGGNAPLGGVGGIQRVGSVPGGGGGAGDAGQGQWAGGNGAVLITWYK